MLLLLTLCYCGLVWLIFYKLKWLEFTKRRKIAVVAIGVAGLLYLVVALLLYMPSMSGTAFVQQPVVEVRADVGGRVTQVWVELQQDVKQGDRLFEVDPEPYRDRAEQAEAAYRQAQQDVKEMQAALDAATADVANVEAELEVLAASIDAAVANVAAAKANVQAQQSGLAAAKADVENAKVDVRIGEQQYRRTEELVERAAATQSDLDRATREIESRAAALKKSEALEVQARDAVASSKAQLASTEAAERQVRRQQASLEAQREKARAGERQARLRLESTIDGEHTVVRQARKAYELAKWDLDHTITYAPADGYVANAQLRVGAIVGKADRVMTFVCAAPQWIVARVPQSAAHYIAAGDPVELTFKLYPGRIFGGRVRNIGLATGESQPVATGQLPTQAALTPATTYAVVIEPDAPPADRPLHFGAAGTAAVYTKNAQVFHIIRKVILRIESWTNYLG